MSKVCSRCKLEKEEFDFTKRELKNGRVKFGYCKRCTSDYLKEYKKNNKKRIQEVNKKWADENKEHLKSWRKENRDGINKSWKKMYYKDDISTLKQRLRSATRRYLNKQEGVDTENIVGCNYDSLLVHLLLTLDKKDRFIYLKNKSDFHIDHIIPISWAEDKDSVIELSNYKNLRLCAKEENWRKGNRWT
jgi:predicted transposase YbfD/YdcC